MENGLFIGLPYPLCNSGFFARKHRSKKDSKRIASKISIMITNYSATIAAVTSTFLKEDDWHYTFDEESGCNEDLVQEVLLPVVTAAIA